MEPGAIAQVKKLKKQLKQITKMEQLEQPKLLAGTTKSIVQRKVQIHVLKGQKIKWKVVRGQTWKLDHTEQLDVL